MVSSSHIQIWLGSYLNQRAKPKSNTPGSRVELWPKLDASFQNIYQEQGSMNLVGPGSDNQTQKVTPES